MQPMTPPTARASGLYESPSHREQRATEGGRNNGIHLGLGGTGRHPEEAMKGMVSACDNHSSAQEREAGLGPRYWHTLRSFCLLMTQGPHAGCTFRLLTANFSPQEPTTPQSKHFRGTVSSFLCTCLTFRDHSTAPSDKGSGRLEGGVVPDVEGLLCQGLPHRLSTGTQA